MAQFNRFIQVLIGSNTQSATALAISPDQRVSFSCIKTDADDSNKLIVDIYNISESTRSLIEKKGAKIILKAGYSQDFVEVLAIGDIARYETIKNGPDVITRVSAGDGLSAIRDSKISLSYNKGVTPNALLSRISDEMGLDFFEISPKVTGSYKNGFSYAGRPKDALNKITRRFNAVWSIQNNGLLVLSSSEARQGEAILLSADKGMLGLPTKWDDSGARTDDVRAGVKVESRLNPRIEPRSLITIESTETSLSGTYRVETVSHKGDNRGNEFSTHIEARNV